MYYIGIDWADQKHDICILSSNGDIHSEFVIENSVNGFNDLQKRLKTLNQMCFNIERSDGLLIDWLVRNQKTVYVISPVSLHHRRPRRTKDDRGDAYLLAHLIRMKDVECRLLTQRSDLVRHLQQLLQAYDSLLREQRRFGNRLLYLLKQYFPTAIKAFCQPHRLVSLAMLERYPTPEAAKSASVDDLRQVLLENKYTKSKIEAKVTYLYAQFQAPVHQAQTTAGYARHVTTLIPILRHLYRGRYDLEREIIALFPAHPDATWWTTFPGSQLLTAARLLAWIGDDRKRFPTANVLQAVAGTVPVTRRSGKSRSIEFRTACSHRLRKAMDDFCPSKR